MKKLVLFLVLLFMIGCGVEQVQAPVVSIPSPQDDIINVKDNTAIQNDKKTSVNWLELDLPTAGVDPRDEIYHGFFGQLVGLHKKPLFIYFSYDFRKDALGIISNKKEFVAQENVEIILSNPDIVSFINDKYVPVKIEFTYTHYVLFQEFGVYRVPHFVIFLSETGSLKLCGFTEDQKQGLIIMSRFLALPFE